MLVDVYFSGFVHQLSVFHGCFWLLLLFLKTFKSRPDLFEMFLGKLNYGYCGETVLHLFCFVLFCRSNITKTVIHNHKSSCVVLFSLVE